MAKRKPLRAGEDSKFEVNTLKALAKDLQANRFASMTRLTVSDDMVTGLRAIITKDGNVSFHASYHFGDERKYLKLGMMDPKSPEYISIADARELTKSIKALALRGTDVQEGLHSRLIRELKRDGTAWRAK